MAQSNSLLFISIFLIILSIILLYKYDGFAELSVVFLLLVFASVILLRYYDV